MHQNPKIKLLYITNGIKGPAGLERVLSVKASYLADELGYEVHILTLNNNGAVPFYEFSTNIIYHDVSVSGNPFRYIKSYLGGIKTAVKQIQPDIILVCDDGLKGFFLPILLRKPCSMLYERHVSKIIELGEVPSFFTRVKIGFKFFVMNQLAKTFDRFVVLTEDNLKEWNGKNVVVISNPLSFYPEQSSTLVNKNVIAVGKQGYQKGYDRLLNSWRMVVDQFPDWTLSIYGSFEASGDLVNQCKRLKIENSVSFYEPVQHIENKFLESSIFVFSSRFEGFGMVLIEAMACGVPCVSYDCPCGPNSIIADGEDGFLVENGDESTFALRILDLIKDNDLRVRMGNKAKNNVKRYLPQHILVQWDTLFKELSV
ncbi:glycosyltransferase family 4 protein [Flavobacterium lacus]|uniref:Glycosyltransferase involved in cell wall biosynthesis n=1 Tax=Flavobacterium lacus TaxID=1353778 RepID=A0A328X722_9FLAO|nr:glycosyltransferase family 4 protein [Flavobacterium lacus]RAR51138.1 glycosyltransferase involved in cell wall biosynthesis [Flavobacterium lacus]